MQNEESSGDSGNALEMVCRTPGMDVAKPLLTIAIPTYNRAELLHSCLKHVLPQVEALGGRVELLVSDNASTDATQELLAGLLASGASLRYVRNSENIGPDRNFVQCLALASGTYFLLLGDDDLVLEGTLEKLLPLLEGERPGIVHLGSFPFKGDHRRKIHRHMPSGKVLRFTDRTAFAAKVNVMFTFISANVIDKSSLGPEFCSEEFLGTNLVQLSWTLEALLHSGLSLFVDDHLIAATTDNSGGYGFYRVFGVNMNHVFDKFMARGADPSIFEAINRKTITTFFPDWILRQRRKRQDSFVEENPVEVLRPIFKGFPAFWLMILPVSTWPLFIAKPWYKACRKWLKLTWRW